RSRQESARSPRPRRPPRGEVPQPQEAEDRQRRRDQPGGPERERTVRGREAEDLKHHDQRRREREPRERVEERPPPVAGRATKDQGLDPAFGEVGERAAQRRHGPSSAGAGSTWTAWSTRFERTSWTNATSVTCAGSTSIDMRTGSSFPSATRRSSAAAFCAATSARVTSNGSAIRPSTGRKGTPPSSPARGARATIRWIGTSF